MECAGGRQVRVGGAGDGWDQEVEVGRGLVGRMVAEALAWSVDGLGKRAAICERWVALVNACAIRKCGEGFRLGSVRDKKERRTGQRMDWERLTNVEEFWKSRTYLRKKCMWRRVRIRAYFEVLLPFPNSLWGLPLF